MSPKLFKDENQTCHPGIVCLGQQEQFRLDGTGRLELVLSD